MQSDLPDSSRLLKQELKPSIVKCMSILTLRLERALVVQMWKLITTVIVCCRFAEMWQELPPALDELPET